MPTLVYSKCLMISCVLMLQLPYLPIAQKSEQNRGNMKETDELAVCDGGTTGLMGGTMCLMGRDIVDGR